MMSKIVEKESFLYEKRNYLLLGGGVLLVVIGFALMSGDTQDIFSTRRLTVAPLVIIAGYTLGLLGTLPSNKIGKK